MSSDYEQKTPIRPAEGYYNKYKDCFAPKKKKEDESCDNGKKLSCVMSQGKPPVQRKLDFGTD